MCIRDSTTTRSTGRLGTAASAPWSPATSKPAGPPPGCLSASSTWARSRRAVPGPAPASLLACGVAR
eukprot:8139898-Alexandrium_andersonii.AAC.1